MKTNQIKENKNEILGINEGDGYDSSIAEGKEQKMFAILSENLYSDPFGSIVRELTSNAVDATVEAGNNEPVIVGFEVEETGTSLIIKDSGTGISEDRAKNVFSKMLASTKEDSSDQIGSWGLGRLSAFAYTDMFYVITNYNGTKYTYVMVKKEFGFRMELMNSTKTDDDNGTTIKIPISYEDKYGFEEAILKQLVYFDNIYYVGVDNHSDTGINDYTIYESKTFKYNNAEPVKGIHICLGNVYYPINFSKVDIEEDYYDDDGCDVGLKFDIGELHVTPNRENILYTQESIKAINNKYQEFLKETEELYNKNAEEDPNLETVVDAHISNIKKLYLSDEDFIILDNHNNGNLKQLGWDKYPDLSFSSSFLKIHNCLFRYTRYRHNTINTGSHYSRDILDEDKVYFGDEDAIPAKKRRYLSSEGYYTVTFQPNLSRSFCLWKEAGDRYYKKSLFNAVGLGAYPKSEWRNILKEIISWYEKNYKEKLPLVSSVVVPDTFEPKQSFVNWEDIRKAEGKILVHIGRESKASTFHGVGTLYSKFEVKIKDLISGNDSLSRNLVIYGTSKQLKLLDKLEYLTRRHNNIRVVKVASKYLKVMEMLPNSVECIKLKNMKAHEYPAITNCLTGLYAKNKLREVVNGGYNFIKGNERILEFLNSDIHDNYHEMMNKYIYRTHEYSRIVLSDEEEEWLNFAVANNLLNADGKEKIDKVCEYIKELDFLELLKTGNYNDKVIWTTEDFPDPDSLYARIREFIIYLCKLKHMKLDERHYKSSLIQEEVEEEEVEEEVNENE